MENDEKTKPRTQSYLKNKGIAFKKYLEETEEITEKYTQDRQNISNIKFCLMQSSLERKKIIDNIFALAYFYDQNFVGNKDFMHIPNIKQITNNFYKYPIILAKQKNRFGIEEIVGATTIKIENNKLITDNPYFPTKNENILKITGILAKKDIYDISNNKIKGIGKQLFKSAIKGAYEINKEQKIRLICEIDCRNINSFQSLSNAVKELQKENINISLELVGYYEIMDNQKNLTEAPTFLLEIGLNENKKLNKKEVLFSYTKLNLVKLFPKLTCVIKRNTTEIKEHINPDGKKLVVYHEIKPIDALKMTIEPGITAIGNDRVPIVKVKPVQLKVANI